MPQNKMIFPDYDSIDEDGILAIGGNLEVDTLISAYSKGIFPWYNESQPILWWSPDPRLVLFPEKFKISKSLRQRINQGRYSVKVDTCFEQVIENCAASKRKSQRGTWITKEMIKAYNKLHKAGYAHSFETFEGKELVGGLYGVSLGKAFFGESMFYNKTDASKIALYHLIETMKKWKFHFIDAQQSTPHMMSLGAIEISRNDFLKNLNIALKYPSKIGQWNIMNNR